MDFALTPARVARWNAMARGGRRCQVARWPSGQVVDGAVTSAPRLESTGFAGRGVLTGLDGAAAQRLADVSTAPDGPRGADNDCCSWVGWFN